jgi:hypothetical protein
LGPLNIFTEICGDIRNLVFIAGVNDTDDNLYMLVSTTPATKQLQQCQLFYIYMKKKNHNMSVKATKQHPK